MNRQQLIQDWKRKRGDCIICGEREGVSDDHIPPKVLLPKSFRNSTNGRTFPVCRECNVSSSDEDYLLSVILALTLNQDSILKDCDPSDPDLLALYEQTRKQLDHPKESPRRLELLRKYFEINPKNGLGGFNLEKLPLNKSLTKIVKAIYWEHTQGDILQLHNPGWWIRSHIDTTKVNFVNKHLKTTHAEINWDDRFISRFAISLPVNGVGGLICCSLHFYTKRALGKGMSWYLIAAPHKTMINDTSLYELCKSACGDVTIPPVV